MILTDGGSYCLPLTKLLIVTEPRIPSIHPIGLPDGIQGQECTASPFGYGGSAGRQLRGLSILHKLPLPFTTVESSQGSVTWSRPTNNVAECGSSPRLPACLLCPPGTSPRHIRRGSRQGTSSCVGKRRGCQGLHGLLRRWAGPPTMIPPGSAGTWGQQQLESPCWGSCGTA